MRQVVITLAALGSDFVGTSTERALAQSAAPARVIEIVVDGAYAPDRIVVREGERVRLRFVRHDYSSCTREVVFPWLGLRRELPPHQPVTIELPALAAGEHEFHCGMGMVRGTIMVQAR
ncbi:MAG: cupredoxin domain-containing protein [Deltaproteobacteria bacterium]|nr:cupredoxin domain-containing protein [Deltaproteobacteria bacterium]